MCHGFYKSHRITARDTIVSVVSLTFKQRKCERTKRKLLFTDSPYTDAHSTITDNTQ